MLEKGKISAAQIGKMMYLAVTPTAILSTPAISFKFAGQDLWISPLLAFSGVLVILIALGFHRLYPGLNYVQISDRVLGPVIGKTVGLALLFYYMYTTGIIIREYGDFVAGAFLPQTPLLVVTGSMVFLCALAVRGGVEIIARFADVFIPVFSLLFLLLTVPLLPELKITNMLPIMGEGIAPSLSGSFILQAWYSEFVLVSFFLPFAHNADQAKKTAGFSLLAVVLTLVASNLLTLLLLGNVTGNYTYPFLIVARYINLAEFFNHLESLFMVIWVVGAFVKICIFFYVTVLGTAQWMQLSDYRPIVFPLGFLLILMSIWVAPNLQYLSYALSTTANLSALTAFLIIPALLLLLGVIRKRMGSKA